MPFSFSAVVLAALTAVPLTPPPALVAQVSDLKQIDRVSDLPAPIAAGEFSVDGVTAKGWRMSDPGGPFNATDEIVDPNAPGRRLLFAACDPTVCAIVYEIGGVAHTYRILAFQLNGSTWHTIWNAMGPKPLANLPALRTLVEHPTTKGGWTNVWVKGDF